MSRVASIAELEALYGRPSRAATAKVARELTPLYRRWIEASRFCILATVGPEGTDASPRGDDGPVVLVDGPRRLLLPDWAGNNRLDSLRNIVLDGRVSLLFLVPGSSNVVRVNARGSVDVAPELLVRFARGERLPRSVVVLEVVEVYFQCARAIMRSGLWSGAAPADLPSAGDLLAEASAGEEGGAGYDVAWPERAARSLW